MTGTSIVQDQRSQQLVYEAYSNVSDSAHDGHHIPRVLLMAIADTISQFVQGLFELMDVMDRAAPTLIALDKQAEFRMPSVVREVGGVTDALLLVAIAVFPPESSYFMQASNQKSQVDTHFRGATHSFHLATANTGSPYSNMTALRA